MSLDVTLRGQPKSASCECSSCGHKHSKIERECFYDANITHNLNKMADAAGLYEALWSPTEIGAKTAHDLIGKLGVGLDVLKKDPEHFKKFNPDNGWGKYENLVVFVEKYLNACIENPDAEIEISK